MRSNKLLLFGQIEHAAILILILVDVEKGVYLQHSQY